MKMKKSLIAAAVASVCAAPMAAQAEPNVWGEFIAGVQMDNDDASGEVNNEGETRIDLDSANFGIEGSEDLGNGLTFEGGTELAVGTDATNVTTDNTYGALSGDFGSVLLGWAVDSAFYLHVLEPTDIGEVRGGYLAFNRAAGNLGFVGDASSETVQYGYDGGAFQLTVEGVMNESGDDNTAGGDNEFIDTMGIGASFAAGPVDIGIGHETNNRAADNVAEPSMTGFSVSGAFGGVNVGASYAMFDSDAAGNPPEPTSFDVAASADLGGGMGILGGVGIYDADTNDDSGNMTGFHVQLSQDLSSRTMVFGQLESRSIDGGNTMADSDPQIVYLGVSHAF